MDKNQNDINQTFGSGNIYGTTTGGDGVPGCRQLEPGAVLLDRYRLEKMAGSGGMGEVWKATDLTAEIPVALKFISRDISHYELKSRRVKRVFQITHHLSHPNICPIRLLEEDPIQGYFIVMHWLDCHALSDFLPSRNRQGQGKPIIAGWKRAFGVGGKQEAAAFPRDQITLLVQKAADALDYAHREGVIHRDIKPSNILVSLADGRLDRLYLIDFGLATETRNMASGLSESQIRMSGTRPYMPPEQWRGRGCAQDARTDQYSLAVVVYELYAGHTPFNGTDLEIMRKQVLEVPPEPIKGVPDHVNAALHKALDKDPEDRFDTCADFAAALAGLRPVSDSQDSDSERGSGENPFEQSLTNTEQSRHPSWRPDNKDPLEDPIFPPMSSPPPAPPSPDGNQNQPPKKRWGCTCFGCSCAMALFILLLLAWWICILLRQIFFG